MVGVGSKVHGAADHTIFCFAKISLFSSKKAVKKKGSYSSIHRIQLVNQYFEAFAITACIKRIKGKL